MNDNERVPLSGRPRPSQPARPSPQSWEQALEQVNWPRMIGIFAALLLGTCLAVYFYDASENPKPRRMTDKELREAQAADAARPLASWTIMSDGVQYGYTDGAGVLHKGFEQRWQAEAAMKTAQTQIMMDEMDRRARGPWKAAK